jgi:hypothetical protein
VTDAAELAAATGARDAVTTIASSSAAWTAIAEIKIKMFILSS